MKVAIITDTHYGARKGSKHLHDYFEKFYADVFFPTLEKEGVTTVVHMGDIFDSRKSIDYQSLEWAKRVVFDPLKKYKVHAVIGNHDCYYKNTNEVNSPELLLQDYSNISTYSEASEIKIDNLNILLLPWINSENFESSSNVISKYLISSLGNINKKPLVGLGVVGTNTFTSCLDVFLEISPLLSLVAKPTAQDPLRGYSTSTTFLFSESPLVKVSVI